MAGSIAANASNYNKKPYKYVPPTPPAELMDCSNYVLDFTDRKFIQIGMDPANNFAVMVHVITHNRYIAISPEFLKRTFSLMGNILSFILEIPVKYKRNIFLDTEFETLSSMAYRDETVLVIESKTQVGCRVLLNRRDLMTLQNIEWCIFETVTQKTAVSRPIISQQIEQIYEYLDSEIKDEKKPYEIVTYIKNLNITDSLPKIEQSFISQIKLLAAEKLAEHWTKRFNNKQLPKIKVREEFNTRCITPPSTPSPPLRYFEDIAVLSSAKNEDQMDFANSYSPMSPSVMSDENDGPDFFNYRHEKPSTSNRRLGYSNIARAKRTLY